jgi:hypothetical protein
MTRRTTTMGESTEFKDVLDGLDVDAIWLSWACPDCKTPVVQHIHDIAFAIDLDVTLDKQGCVTPYIQTKCPFCSCEFEQKLTRAS